MTPQHVACSLRLMSIWHAYHIVESGSGKPEIESQPTGVTIKDLRQLARLVSKFSGEKTPTNILNELDRTFADNIQFPQFQSLLVNKYRYDSYYMTHINNIISSRDPLDIDTISLEQAVWNDYYGEIINKQIKENGKMSRTVCFSLWQVFNRMADEQYYPPALPKFDLVKILAKSTKVSSY